MVFLESSKSKLSESPFLPWELTKSSLPICGWTASSPAACDPDSLEAIILGACIKWSSPNPDSYPPISTLAPEAAGVLHLHLGWETTSKSVDSCLLNPFVRSVRSPPVQSTLASTRVVSQGPRNSPPCKHHGGCRRRRHLEPGMGFRIAAATVRCARGRHA